MGLLAGDKTAAYLTYVRILKPRQTTKEPCKRDLLSYCVRDKECSSNGQDSVQLGERSEDKGLTHNVVTVTDSSDTVSTNLCLIVRSHKVYQTYQQTCTKYSRSLIHGNIGGQKTLNHEETYEAVETL